MGCGGKNTGILPRARHCTFAGDTYQLLLGVLHLLAPLGLPAQADTSLEAAAQSTREVGISYKGLRCMMAR